VAVDAGNIVVGRFLPIFVVMPHDVTGIPAENSCFCNFQGGPYGKKQESHYYKKYFIEAKLL
jgi:hypothetical protein